MTFRFTDIEGSTRVVRDLGDRWRGVIETHDALLMGAVTGHGGTGPGH